jgi:Secretion system C-terminal sorting domain
LVLNEFSASDDWIELFNAGNAPIELSGLYITDDPLDKQKHLLTNNGQPWTLAVGGYQLLWADNNTAAGPDHLQFGLSSGGDEIGMYQFIGGNATELFLESFGAQTSFYSLARLPNGSGPFGLTPLKTPGEENKGYEGHVLFPNPADTHFSILLKEEDAVLSLHDQLGRKLTEYSFSTKSLAEIDVSRFSPGFYIVRVVYPSETITTKLILSR